MVKAVGMTPACYAMSDNPFVSRDLQQLGHQPRICIIPNALISDSHGIPFDLKV